LSVNLKGAYIGKYTPKERVMPVNILWGKGMKRRTRKKGNSERRGKKEGRYREYQRVK
jgi:hypothetical protein